MTTVAVAGSTYTFNIALYQQADPLLLQTPPTLDAADFTRSINGGALGALDNTPTVLPAGGCQVRIILSAAETAAAGEGGLIAVYWQDAVGAEWCSGGALVPIYAGEPTTDDVWTDLRASYIDTDISTRMQAGAAVDLSAAAVTAIWAAAARTLTGYGTLVADVATAVWGAGVRTLTAYGTLVADTAAAVWNRATALLTVAGSVGRLVVEKLGLITAAGIDVTITGPVIAGGNVVTYRGDSYLVADGRELSWQSAGFPTLTGSAIAVIIEDVGTFAGAVVAADECLLELTAAQSATIPRKRHKFQVVATQGTMTATLVEASWVSRDRAEV